VDLKLIIICIAAQMQISLASSETVGTLRTPRGENFSGETHLVSRLESLGFKCENASKRRQMCRGKVESYPLPVRIYVPTDQRPGPGIAFHFHGNNIGPGGPQDSSIHFKNGAGDFGAWLDEADSRDILVVPESRGKTTTYDSIFRRDSLKETAKNFSLLLRDLENLAGQSFSKIAISGHSAGYRAIGALGLARAADPSSELNRVSTIGLFDAVYGRTAELVSWIPHLKSRSGVFYCVYAEHGGTVNQGPGDQRAMNEWLEKNEGLIPVSHAKGKTTSGLSVTTTTAEHMDVLKDGRFSDYLRVQKSDTRQKK
jgi:hypothetical protein